MSIWEEYWVWINLYNPHSQDGEKRRMHCAHQHESDIFNQAFYTDLFRFCQKFSIKSPFVLSQCCLWEFFLSICVFGYFPVWFWKRYLPSDFTSSCSLLSHYFHRWIYNIPMVVVRHRRCRRLQCSNIFLYDTALPIQTKFYVALSWESRTESCLDRLGYMANMAATPIYGKSL